jgi:ADP-ribose pyrophosphatase YjhB (NUDIX family)
MTLFCSECGSELPQVPPVICANCGVSHWLNAKPAACVLITRGKEVLLIRRATEPWLGAWDIPGGFCEEKEHPLLAAEREAFEETGLRVRITGFLGIWMDTYSNGPEGLSRTTMNVFYHGLPVDDDQVTQVTDEASAIAWFGPDDLPEDVAFPSSQRLALAAWRESLDRGELVTPLLDRLHLLGL